LERNCVKTSMLSNFVLHACQCRSEVDFYFVLIVFKFSCCPFVLIIFAYVMLQYYARTGSCKFGASCKYHHPRQAAGTTAPVSLNCYGYPLRVVCTLYHFIFVP
jgi:hypothetical protein